MVGNNGGTPAGSAVEPEGQTLPLYLTWADDTEGNYEIMFGKSTDDGATWKTRRLTKTDGTSEEPAMAIEGRNVYIVWFDDTYGNYEILLDKSTDGGATWEFQRLTDNPGKSYGNGPSIAAQGRNVYVVWMDDTTGNNEILLNVSTDAGATWQTQRLTDNPGSSGEPSVAVQGRDVYVVWEDEAADDAKATHIFFNKSTDGGATWRTQRLTENKGGLRIPTVAVEGQNVYVLWRDDTYAKQVIFFNKSTDGGATWQTRRLADTTGGTQGLSLALDGRNVYVLWRTEASGKQEIFFNKSTDGGATWKLLKLVADNAGWSKKTSVAADGRNISVAFQDTTPGNNEIFFAKSTDGGDTWKFKRVTDNAGVSTSPALSLGRGR
ncbi:MAG: exo-alpha-sialidase [Deltaproteobacteria bacterium]|nr:exo-alpha-sialidase [Deltaproteobacteria bacterium]